MHIGGAQGAECRGTFGPFFIAALLPLRCSRLARTAAGQGVGSCAHWDAHGRGLKFAQANRVSRPAGKGADAPRGAEQGGSVFPRGASTLGSAVARVGNRRSRSPAASLRVANAPRKPQGDGRARRRARSMRSLMPLPAEGVTGVTLVGRGLTYGVGDGVDCGNCVRWRRRNSSISRQGERGRFGVGSTVGVRGT